MSRATTGGYQPLVSVLIPMFNADRWIQDCASSILKQSYRNFEVVIWDDGSLDNSYVKAKALEGAKLRLFGNKRNLGAPIARNKLLDAARGDLIAWIDADDRAHPNRLEAQVATFEANPNLVLLGSSVKWIDESRLQDGRSSTAKMSFSKKELITRFATTDSAIRVRQPIHNQFSTSAVMHRASIVREQELRFDDSLWPAEDYSFWSSLLQYGEGYNLVFPFAHERSGGLSHTVSGQTRQRQAACRIRNRIWHELGVPSHHRLTLSRFLAAAPIESRNVVSFWSFLTASYSYASQFPAKLKLQAYLFTLSLGLRAAARRWRH